MQNPGTCEVTLGWEGTAGLGTLSPAWIIDEMCGVETGGRELPYLLGYYSLCRKQVYW